LIRSSALITAVAMAVLVAGVSAANLALIYVSIAVSIVAAVTLAVGVLLWRRELFGETRAAPRLDQPGWAASKTARPFPARPMADDRVTADHGARREDTRRDGEQPGDLAARLRKAGSGVGADTGPARWPASIAAKAAPATTGRGGGHTTGGGGAGWPPRPGSAAGPGRPAEPGRDREGAGRGQGPATARPDREHAGPGRDRGDRDRAAAGRTGRAQTPPGHDRDQETPARRDREPAVRGRDEAVAGQQAEAFRLPPQSERARARAEELGRAISAGPAGDEQERHPAGADEPGDDAARTGATARPAAAGGWSAWAGARAGDQGAGGDAGEAGRDRAYRDAAHDERAVTQATAGAAAGAEVGAAGETSDREAEAGVPDDAAVVEAAGRAGPGGAAPGEAERPGPDGPGETASSTAAAEGGAAPGSPHDAAAMSKAADRSKAAGAEEAAGAQEAGDAGQSGAAGADADGSSPLDDQVTVVPGVPRYHRRGCILIRFLSDGDLEISTRRAAEAAGLVPCKACQPDKPA
jgi:hypothetical protein